MLCLKYLVSHGYIARQSCDLEGSQQVGRLTHNYYNYLKEKIICNTIKILYLLSEITVVLFSIIGAAMV